MKRSASRRCQRKVSDCCTEARSALESGADLQDDKERPAAGRPDPYTICEVRLHSYCTYRGEIPCNERRGSVLTYPAGALLQEEDK